jgi:NAD(P)H-hydrate epimerase
VYSIIFRGIPDSGNGIFSNKSVSEIIKISEKADVLLVGPGLSVNKDTQDMLRKIITIERPLVIDADALNIISEDIKILKRKSITVLTPHHGEMNRLLKGFGIPESNDRIEISKKLSMKTGAIVVLKGNRTVISSPDGQIRINGSGTPALATAGSGDVLAGIIGAFLAQNSDDPFQSVVDAVFIHGCCGEFTGFGNRGTIADDLINLIPEKMREISPFA